MLDSSSGCLGTGTDAVLATRPRYPAFLELAEHRHRLGQFLHATSGVMAVGTPDGAWVVPPERGAWIPAGVPHSVRMVGVVDIRSVLVEPEKCPVRGRSCEVVGVSMLLRQLLVTAAELAAH